MNKKELELLYRSFDGELTREEERMLKEALERSEALRAEKRLIEGLRKAIAAGGNASFGPFFADRVMERIGEGPAAAPEPNGFLRSIEAFFRPVALAAAGLSIVILCINLWVGGRVSLEAAFGVPEATLEEALEPTLPLVME